MADDEEDARPARGRRRSSSMCVSDLPDAAPKHELPDSGRKRSTSLDSGRGHGIHRSVQEDMKVLSNALDTWEDAVLSEDEEADTDSSAADESTREYIKLILLGNSGVGKTSIMIRFDSKKFMENTVSTTGVDFRTKKFSIDGRRVNCQLWDTAGQERFCGITRAYYRDADGILIVYDVTDNSSLQGLHRWIEDLRNNASENCKKILLCNKVDLPHDTTQVARGKEIANENGFTFIRTSAKNGHNIFKAIKHVSRDILKTRVASYDSSALTVAMDNQNQPLVNRNRRCCGR